MSHTFIFHQMHSNISKHNTHCKMTYGCSNLFLNHDWVTPSRILLLVITPSFSHLPHVSTSSVSTHKVTPPLVCMSGKREVFLGLRVYIGALTCGKFFQILFWPWVRDVCYLKNYGYFVLLIHILIYLFNMVNMSTFHICVLRTSEAYICLFIKMTFARWIIWVVIIGKFIRNHGINQEL